jgi:hypothetical protein
MAKTYNLYKFEHRNKDRLEDLQMIQSDLGRAIECVQILLGPPPLHKHAPVFATALQTQALVSYIRCFSTGRRTSLNREVFLAKPELEKDHDEFKKLRDQHVAHPAGSHEHNELIVAADSQDSAAYGIGSYNFFFAGSVPKDLKRFLSLLLYVMKQAKEEETRLGNEMAREMISSKSSWTKAKLAFYKVIHHEQLYLTRRKVGRK